LFVVSNKERVASEEQIDSAFFSINFALWPRRTRFYLNKFIIARPKRELIHHVLGLGNVNRWMTRAFGSLIAQVKRNLRSPVTRVRNKKKLFTQFCFQIIAHCF